MDKVGFRTSRRPTLSVREERHAVAAHAGVIARDPVDKVDAVAGRDQPGAVEQLDEPGRRGAPSETGWSQNAIAAPAPAPRYWRHDRAGGQSTGTQDGK
ncbi:MAG TPA: hypothetical protein VIG48_06310 [Jatrophihabitans sp.]|jgi:hypothetical protein